MADRAPRRSPPAFSPAPSDAIRSAGDDGAKWLAAFDEIRHPWFNISVGDGKRIGTLERAGVKGADTGVVSTGDDITASILATMALRDLKVREIYVKVISLDHARVMEKLGVTESVFPERETALRLGTRIAQRGLLNYVRLGAGFSLQEMAVPESWIGRTLRELALPRRYGISVLAVHDVLQDEMIPVPSPDAKLKDSDTLLIAGSNENLAAAAKVRRTGKPERLEPMNSYERKIVHETVARIQGVRSFSEGEEPRRCVVIEAVD